MLYQPLQDELDNANTQTGGICVVTQKLDDTYTALTYFHQAQPYSSETHLATKDY